MLDKIKRNINKSNLDLNEKLELERYSSDLLEKNLPVLFDEKQIRLVFSIEENLETFIEEAVRQHNILKYSGEVREVFVPNEHLKEIQKWILENILEKVSTSPYTFSFVKGKSIVNHAKLHTYSDQSWLITLDIKDFFPSIKMCSVEEIFKGIGYNNLVSKLLSELCCFNYNLAQGFSTSPILSNIYLKDFDYDLFDFCKGKNIIYSRYADDLAFSGKGIEVDSNLYEEIISKVEGLLRSKNLNLNIMKTKVFKDYHPKKLTGIMLTKQGIKVPLKIKKNLSKEIYYCEKFGVENHLFRTKRLELANYKGYMYGIAGYIKSVEPELGEEFIKRLKNIYWG